MSVPAIAVDSISYAYGDLEAVKSISFEVAPGEILGFLGPNGAGKSTTIKILTGQLQAKSGVARILGQDVTRDDPEVQAQIGVCFEEKNLYLSMTAEENLRFFASLFGLKHVDTDGLLRRVGLAGRARDRVSGFSKGMRQRLMVARALVNRPKVLFLDEPTDGLDPVSSKAIRALIQQEAGRGAAVLLTTHDMAEADELSNRVAFINEGRLHAIDTPENLKLALRQARREGARAGRAARSSSTPWRSTPSDAGEQLKAAVATEGLLTIHTEEATLEDIFIQMTGRRLKE